MDPKETENGGNLINALNETLINLHRHPYPEVPNPPGAKRRSSVALILRIRPRYEHWPLNTQKLDKSISISQQVDDFFSQDWVKHGDPEVLFIKRATRKGDRWTGHIALPGGKRDPEDEDDLSTAIRETSEEIGLDMTTDDYIPIANLPERVVTTSWDNVPLMVLCPFVFLYTSSEPLPLKLQPAEVASTHWVSLRALLSPSLRTVEFVDLAKRSGKQPGIIFRISQRWMTGFMEFSAIQLLPTESLFCSSIPGFIPGYSSSSSSTLFKRMRSWIPSYNSSISTRNRPLLLWGLTLGIMADFLDMLPPHNAIKLWKYPTFTAPDLRFLVAFLTSDIRKENALQTMKAPRRPSQTALDAQTTAIAFAEDDSGKGPDVSRKMSPHIGRPLGASCAALDGDTNHAVGIMLKGYYRRLRMAMYVFAMWRLAAGSLGVWILWRWHRQQRLVG